MYTDDNNAYLPGPCWTGMFFTYEDTTGTPGPERYAGSLSAYIAQYLSYPAPRALVVQTSYVAMCPAAMHVLPKVTPLPPLAEPVNYFSLETVTNYGTNVIEYPFGRPDTPYAACKQISDVLFPSTVWAMTDCDQQLLVSLGITGATYEAYVPLLPVHNGPFPATRQYLYYDWGVRSEKSAK
jgi:hypothetical protein